MNNIIYVDVLIIVNFIVNYFLILAVGKLMSLKINRIHIIGGALVGALFALSIFIPQNYFYLLWIVKIISPLLIIIISYPFRGLRNLFFNTFAMLSISFMFSGIMLLIWIFVPLDNMSYYNGIIYFDINPTLLFILTVVCYIAISLFKRILSSKEPHYMHYKVIITRNCNTVSLNGFLDTGNKLKEPFTGYPVAVCCLNKLTSLLTSDEYLQLQNNDDTLNCPLGFRVIPYNVLEGDGLLYAFLPDKMLLITDEQTYFADEVFIGLSKNEIANNDFNLILPNDIYLEQNVIVK